MENLLRVVGSVDNTQKSLVSEDSLLEAQPTPSFGGIQLDEQPVHTISSPDDVLKVVKSRPSLRAVSQALRYIDPACSNDGEFNILAPTAMSAQILHIIITTTIPDHWSSINTDKRLKIDTHSDKSHKLRGAVLRCLKSVGGLGALLTELRALVAEQNLSQQDKSRQDKGFLILDYLSILSSLLKPDTFLYSVYADITKFNADPVKCQLLWQELTSFLASGQLLSVAAEAVHHVKDSQPKSSTIWVADGKLYSSWIGKAIAYMASQLQCSDTQGWKYLATLTGRSLSIGYSDRTVNEIVASLIYENQVHLCTTLLHALRQHDQRRMSEGILRCLENQFFGVGEQNSTYNKAVEATAAFFAIVINDVPFISGLLQSWLAGGVGGGISSVFMRRSLICALNSRTDSLPELLRKGIELFGDKLFIKHSPIGVQEANAQVILITAGYLKQANPNEMTCVLRNSSYLSGISNRLGAGSPRSRFLGMVVAVALSKLTDKPENSLKFDVEDMESEDALWYISLTEKQDRLGMIEDLKTLRKGDIKPTRSSTKTRNNPSTGTQTGTQLKANRQPHVSKIVSIEEISDESDVDDLIPYEKPDSDAEDSEEDATLVQRGKPTAPVYIRDLLAYLRDTDNFDRYQLGISTAPSLIRRKATFGTELIEHAIDLALTLVGLQDKYSLPKFQEYRLQSLIALVVAHPSILGPWMAQAFFNVDLSLSQRSSLLITLGLSARELAGFRDEDGQAVGLPTPIPEASFPSKRLPASLEAEYNPSTMEKQIEDISGKLIQTSLEPLALNAADTLSGPNALKVRTFSSRMEVEKKRQEREAQRKAKSIPKDLHKILFDAFFTPLLSGFGQMMYAMASYGGNNPLLTPHTLSLFLQTITLIISTSGPGSPQTLSITSDTLTLLVSIHNSPMAMEPVVIKTILALFLAIIDLNILASTTAEQRLVTEFAEQIIEMREWVGAVFERTPREDEQVRFLSAGIMVKLGEVMERYQNRLLGKNAEFSF
ncbi:telomere binding protein [Myotisia sp. PD_48]|nr:telomere binding protein [Myotisia sp. PD_48]